MAHDEKKPIVRIGNSELRDDYLNELFISTLYLHGGEVHKVKKFREVYMKKHPSAEIVIDENIIERVKTLDHLVNKFNTIISNEEIDYDELETVIKEINDVCKGEDSDDF